MLGFALHPAPRMVTPVADAKFSIEPPHEIPARFGNSLPSLAASSAQSGWPVGYLLE